MESVLISDIIAKLELVLENTLTREEVSSWAYKYMTALEDKNSWETTNYEQAVFECLKTVYGMDLLETPTEYLHWDNDIRDWIENFKAIEKEFKAK